MARSNELSESVLLLQSRNISLQHEYFVAMHNMDAEKQPNRIIALIDKRVHLFLYKEREFNY